MVKTVNWGPEVVEDYRERIIVDPDNPILASKANRDRYTNLPNQAKYAGLPHLGSKHSEDALTWNVFRSLQLTRNLDLVTRELAVGEPEGLLLWTLAPDIGDVNADLQYVAASLIRKFDGIFPGQITEPDVILLGTNGIAVIECKLSEPDKAPAHLWEGNLESVRKRIPIYRKEMPGLIAGLATEEDIAPLYQLVRMAFYAMKLSARFGVKPVVVSLANERNWSLKIGRLGKSASELWEVFCRQTLGQESRHCENLTWQRIRQLITGGLLDNLSLYLSTHPSL